MSQVSKFQLTTDVLNRLFSLYIETLINIKGKEQLNSFVDSFFTPTEKVMFAKRLAAAVMLAKQNNYQTIRRTLRISPPTIARMSLQLKYKDRGLSQVVENILKEDSTKAIWEDFAGLLDIPGKGRSMSGLIEARKRRKEKINRLTKTF